MKKIASFTVNHIDLLRGVYVSRKDVVANEHILTTFDIRMKRPNLEPVINNGELHTIEHLAATFLRNHEVWDEKTVYFGPMGCRTGVYVIFKGDLNPLDVLPIITEMFQFIADFEGDIPGATARDCGNYLDMNLPMAKFEAKKFLEEVLTNIKEENMIYPK
ncbi:S-ribosylhomocysteine lyase [Ilyobacter polytropus]|uniref:S-ribosylhomocysteine lyase n=1 Tax=Ilyobacter polytropus (strain ATCC 51220 / DSM 2926 / LMG 16218 / CuHBu1) TaxID=572544 RepID=E3HCL4_ILYPC|nr:S-ribosylhomocysteine lyase [Ilyobacter polytropus]ADO83990.1 quorum-sensing autoinducer 2 (AI-2), LuxS [Ilyobacter polytropus DSM 2926]